MEATRALRIEALKGRIDRSEYQVDVDKVAQAILGRPSARVWVIPPAMSSRQQSNGVAARTPAA